MYKVAIPASLLLFATAAQAQDISPAFDMTTMSNWTSQGAALEQMKRQTRTQIAPRRAPVHPKIAPAQIIARMAYRPDPAVRRQVYLRAVAAIQKGSPQDAAQLRGQLASGKLRATVAQYLANYGMSPNNVVDTTALYLASSWFASRASAADPSPAQMRGLRQQVAVVFSSMPALLGASNAAKQELAEASIVQSVIASALANKAAADPKVAGIVKSSAVRAVGDMYQIDLLQLNLTGQGLR